MIPKSVIDSLLTFARSRKLDSSQRSKALILEEAADSHGIEEQDDAVWAAVLAAMDASPTKTSIHPASKPPPSRFGRRDDRQQVQAVEGWTAADDALVTAPFRFVALNTTVALHEGVAQSHADPTGTLSAVLKVEWAVETPLLVGQEGAQKVSEPFRLGDGRDAPWAIPGATLRGAIRSVVETVAFARLQQINRHRRFALRDFGNKHYQKFVEDSQPDKFGVGGMKAGWLRKDDEGATITPCEWGYVAIAALPCQTDDWPTLDRARKYARLGVAMTGSEAFTKTHTLGPKVVGDFGRRIYPFATTGSAGHLVCSGKPVGAGGNRKYEFVFIDQPGAGAVKLKEAAWEEFQDNNCKPSANLRKPDGAWRELFPAFKEGGRVPVFYVGDLAMNAADPNFSFGLTRLYRIPHKRSIGQVLLDGAPGHSLVDKDGNHQPDFAEHLFGYVHEPTDLMQGHPSGTKADHTAPAEVSRKARVAFGFAMAAKDQFKLWPERDKITGVMGTPKASFGPFYLAGPEKDWSADDAKLAGRKRYLARYGYQTDASHDALQRALTVQAANAKKGEQTTLMRFLVPATETARFTSQIRLHNVTAAELGAILWAVGLGGDKDARHLIGRAKAFGAGQIRADSVVVQVRNNDSDAKSEVTWVPQDGEGIEEIDRAYLAPFKAHVAGLAELSDAAQWDASDQVQGLLATARPLAGKAVTKGGPGTVYLPYINPNVTGQAKDFAALRKKTGIGAGKSVPDPLLPAKQR